MKGSGLFHKKGESIIVVYQGRNSRQEVEAKTMKVWRNAYWPLTDSCSACFIT